MSDQLVTRTISALPAAAGFSRFVKCLARGRGDPAWSRSLAESMRDTPQVAAAFELQTKAATAPGTSTDATWAGPLTASGISADVLQVLRTFSIVGALEGRVRRVPFNTKVPADTTSLLGDWVIEYGAIPVGALALTTLGPLDATKVAIIAVVTRELLELGVASDATVRNGVLGALSRVLDDKFLNPAYAAATDKPASITNAATSVTSTGATAAAIAADLGSMLAALTPSAASPVWIMRPTTAARLTAALGTASSLPASLYGLPAIISANSPAQITLLAADQVLVADDGAFDVSISREAAVHMDTAPDNPPTAATVSASFFQHNMVGVRAVRWINWTRVGATSVVYMTVVY